MAKIGRNQLCWCGSGKKFKKCCLNKPESAEEQSPSPRPFHWFLDEVESMATDDIIVKLRQFGIPFQKERFLSEVRNHYSASELAKEWRVTYPICAQGFDIDFLWMACLVLWERLAPDIMSSERLDTMMQTGYDLIQERRKAEGCDLWLQVWHELKKRFRPSMTDIEEAEEVFSGMQCLFNWCQDLELELHNAGIEDSFYLRKRIELCNEFCTLFPDTSQLTILNMKRAEAESYFLLGESEQGEQLFKSLIDQFPDSIWGYVGWGDMYTNEHFGLTAPDQQKARQIYQMALGKGLAQESVVLDRIKDLEQA